MHLIFFSPPRSVFLTISLDLESIFQKQEKENKMCLFAMRLDWSHVSAAVMTPVVGDLVISH